MSCRARFGFFIGLFVSHQATVVSYPQYLEAPPSGEPRDSRLHPPYAFVRCMRVATGVNERLAVAYEYGLVPVSFYSSHEMAFSIAVFSA